MSFIPPLYLVLPFVALLLMIASGPIFFPHFWEKNYPIISIILGLLVASHYILYYNDTHSPYHALQEYLSFILLLAVLFTVTGGIFINLQLSPTPLNNALFLLAGAVLSNFIGTTGASMLLIRPFIKINSNKLRPYHIIFFIFIVSNISGALTPIGDPPLFLGFLRGVPFFWVLKNVFFIWLPTIFLVLLVFYFLDRKHSKRFEDDMRGMPFKLNLQGSSNFLFLGLIILCVFIDPSVFSFVPKITFMPLGIRELLFIVIAFSAYKLSRPAVRELNEFNFMPIKEVAYLFFGIFFTMIPALQLVSHEAAVYRESLDQNTFYWATGTASAFLDNAPTYLNFLSAAMGKYALDINVIGDVRQFVSEDTIYLQAISVAAVFFGAMTYIGNGPNFMVKSISERSGIKMPGFFEYIYKYSIPVLLPLFAVIWFVFFYWAPGKF
ncbi:MAG: sodium:proton antiporter [Ignavibacteriaceae bacterium]|nr:sodium:proton antiporter [Ignavibacteriaceae bacterium]